MRAVDNTGCKPFNLVGQEHGQAKYGKAPREKERKPEKN